MNTGTVRKCALLLLLILGVSVTAVMAASKKFSFLVFGDTRPDVMLYGCDLGSGIPRVLETRYGTDGDFVYKSDPAGIIDNCLESLKVVETDKTTTLHYNFKAVPETISVNKEGKDQMLFSFKGWKTLACAISSEFLNSPPKQKPTFSIHGGDMVLFGFQGKVFSPYWMLFQSYYGTLAIPNADGMPRFFAAVGNHELWDDPEMLGMRYHFPWLKKYGFTNDNRIYHFIHKNGLFIFLDSGDYSFKGTAWVSTKPGFDKQMNFLRERIQKAPKHVKHVFVVYHKPSFAQVGHNPLPKDQNPHYVVLKDFAAKYNIMVFNSHVHSTEYYKVDGIHYVVAGSGGASQAFEPCDLPSQEPELYWKGKPRTFELNYMKVHIKGKKLRVDVHRFKPPDFKAEALRTLIKISK
ncbi:MAG: hypothetical protein GY757_36995 [bacterium]|nr:hypothetical protein [bacterium]